MNKFKFLKKNKILRYLPDNIFEKLVICFKEQKYKNSEFIIKRNMPISYMYFIVSGKVKIRCTHKRDTIYGEGDFFGESTLLKRHNSEYDAVALTANVNLLVLDRYDFIKYAEEYPILYSVITYFIADCLSAGDNNVYSKAIGNFNIVQKIDYGSMGVVFKGEHTILKYPVAIKMLSHRYINDGIQIRRLLDLAKGIAGFKHKNITKIIDVEQAYGTYFIVMEYIEGVSLKKIIDYKVKIPDEVARGILKQIAGGLSIVHQNGIIHSNIKPSNIMITKDGIVKITDFCIAHIDSLNPYFMSPEQMNGETSGHLTDIYSLGVTFYYLLTGSLPFYDVDIKNTIEKVQKSEPIPVKELNPNVPKDLDIFIIRALSKKPKNRLQSLFNIDRLLNVWSQENEDRLDNYNTEKQDIQANDKGFLEISNWLNKNISSIQRQRIKQNQEKINHFVMEKQGEDNFLDYEYVFYDEPAYNKNNNLDNVKYFKKKQIPDYFACLENERQELALVHAFTRNLVSIDKENELFSILNRIIKYINNECGYCIVLNKQAEVKSEAKRIYASDNYLLSKKNDLKLLNRAEKLSGPLMIKEGDVYILLCPIKTKKRYWGVICLSSRENRYLETKKRFFKFICDVLPVKDW